MDTNVFRSLMLNSAISLFRVPMLTVQDFEALRVSAAEELFITQQQLEARRRLNATTFRRHRMGDNGTHQYRFKAPLADSPLTAPGGAP